MFMRFYAEIDSDESLAFEMGETVDCFERFAQDESLMGRKKVQTVIEHMGIDVTGGLMSFFKEGGDQSMAFSEEIYE